MDMIVTFNTSYYDTAQEKYITSRRLIAKNYLKFWFWIDFFSTVPIDNIAAVFTRSSSSLSAIRAIRILRLGRLTKLKRLKKVGAYLEEELGITPALLSLLGVFLQILFIAHLFACFWHFLTLPVVLTSTVPRTWVSEGGYTDSPNEVRYVAALYYTIATMMTVGYGDIHATNATERVYSIFVMLAGGMVYGALLSKVATVLEKSDPQAKALRENMDEIRAFLEESSLPLGVKSRAKVSVQ